MKQSFLDYLKMVGVKEPLHKRIEGILQFYKELCPEDITDIFVSEYLTQDGNREYSSVWFFSANYVMEAKYFIEKDDFDIMALNQITYLEIEKKDYDFKQAKAESRMTAAYAAITNLVTGKLQSSQENCDVLKHILLEYLIPQVRGDGVFKNDTPSEKWM